MAKRTTESIRSNLLELQRQDLELIVQTTPHLGYEDIMRIGKARQEIGTQIQHEWDLWIKRGFTYEDLTAL